MHKNGTTDGHGWTRIKPFLSVCICVHLWLLCFVLEAANPELLTRAAAVTSYA
jgi:hypothetical protein